MARRPLCLLALLLVLAQPLLSPGAATAAPADWDVPGGHFFTQTGGGGRGFAVTDEGSLRFWSEFRRLGGVTSLGYPISQRFEWEGYTVQAFQRVVLQWRPEAGRVAFVNVFDRLHELGQDGYLAPARQTPPPKDWADGGLPWSEVVRLRLSVLDGWPALRSSYLSVVGDPVEMRGLPTSDVVDVGNHYAVRTQRAVLQLWKENVPWARAGEVTVALGGDMLKGLGVFPAAAVEPVLPGDALLSVRGRERRINLGYYVPYDPSSWQSLESNAAEIDFVAAQWVSVNACGSLGSEDDRTLNAFARERGIKVLPSLLTSDGWLNHRLLADEAVTSRFVDEIVSYVLEGGYDGFDLDLEAVEAEDRQAYTVFVARLADALHARGKLLTLAIPAKTSDVRTGWAGAYDYAALGRSADLILIMSYSYTWSTSPPGSTAPYDWVDEVTAYAASQIPPERLLVGVAFYGYDWNLTMGGTARALLYPQAVALADRYGVPIRLDPDSRSTTFSYVARAGDVPPSVPGAPRLSHVIVERNPSPCSVRPPETPPSPPRPTPAPAPLQRHEVWLEDATAVGYRLAIAASHGVAGVGAWRLGEEDPATWTRIAEWRRAR